MYKRSVKMSPKKLVDNGKINFGTFLGHPDSFSVRKAKPSFFGVRLPAIITDTRIRARLSYYFSFGDLAGIVEVIDEKLLGLAIVVIVDTKGSFKYIKQSLLGAKGHRVPKRLSGKDDCICHCPRSKIHLYWDRKKNFLSLRLRLKGIGKKSINLYATCPLEGAGSEVTTSLPALSKSRVRASYKHSALTTIATDETSGTGVSLLDINRSYTKRVSLGVYLMASFICDGEAVSLALSQTKDDAQNKDSYNENFLFCSNIPTPLPPVDITAAQGADKTWVIEDTYGMVDLVFEPFFRDKKGLDLIAVRAKVTMIFGHLSGFVMDKRQKKWQLSKAAALIKLYDFVL